MERGERTLSSGASSNSHVASPVSGQVGPSSFAQIIQKKKNLTFQGEQKNDLINVQSYSSKLESLPEE